MRRAAIVLCGLALASLTPFYLMQLSFGDRPWAPWAVLVAGITFIGSFFIPKRRVR